MYTMSAQVNKKCNDRYSIRRLSMVQEYGKFHSYNMYNADEIQFKLSNFREDRRASLSL